MRTKRPKLGVVLVAMVFGSGCGHADTTDRDAGGDADGGLDSGDLDGSLDGSFDANADGDVAADGDATVDASHPDDELLPLLSGFRVEPAHPDRVAFDSSEPITASTAAGFVVSGRLATGIHLEPDALTGHYVEVDSAFDFWDNNTIRYDGSGDVRDLAGNALYELTLQYIDNELPEPEARDHVFFVDASVSASGDGRSEATAFRTVQEGVDAIAAEASPEGSTLWIRAGDYGGESIDMSTSGTPDKPIKIIGYRLTPGDIDEMYWTYGRDNPLVASEMPLFDGGLSVERAVEINSDYVIYRNLQARDYFRTFVAEGSPEGVVVDNCLVNNTFGTHGNGIGFKGQTATRNRILRSTVVNASMLNFAMRGTFSLVESCRSYGDDRGNGTDYYMDIKGSHNIVRDNVLHRTEHNDHPGHGLSLKGRAIDNSETAVWIGEHNLIERCIVRNIRMAIHFGHKEVRYNVVRDITITGDRDISDNGNGGILVLNSSYNLFEQIFVDIDGGSSISFGATSEDRISEHGAHHNVVRNSVFRGGGAAVRIAADGDSEQDRDIFDNQVLSSTFVDHAALESNGAERAHSGNSFGNCIIVRAADRTVIDRNPSSFTFTYTSFYDNAFAAPEGEGNLSVDPEFTNESDDDFTPGSPALAAGTPIAGLRYDFVGRERDAATPTIGAYERP